MLYLDYVDFGARQVPDFAPRISVWKGGMIKDYTDYDLKSMDSYGFHPLVDASRTCYSKVFLFLYICSAFFIFPYSTLNLNFICFFLGHEVSVQSLFYDFGRIFQ